MRVWVSGWVLLVGREILFRVEIVDIVCYFSILSSFSPSFLALAIKFRLERAFYKRFWQA